LSAYGLAKENPKTADNIVQRKLSYDHIWCMTGEESGESVDKDLPRSTIKIRRTPQ